MESFWYEESFRARRAGEGERALVRSIHNNGTSSFMSSAPTFSLPASAINRRTTREHRYNTAFRVSRRLFLVETLTLRNSLTVGRPVGRASEYVSYLTYHRRGIVGVCRGSRDGWSAGFIK